MVLGSKLRRIHCAGLEVSFLVRMEDVTEAVMKDVDLNSDQNKQDIKLQPI